MPRAAGVDRRHVLSAIASACCYPLASRCLAQGVPVQVPAPRGEDVSDAAKALRKTRWSPGRAAQYLARFGVIKGCNYVTQDASSPLAEASERLVERELGWARDMGLNSIRVFLSAMSYQKMGDRLFTRLDRLLDIAAKQGMSFIPVLNTNTVTDPAYKPDPTEPRGMELRLFCLESTVARAAGRGRAPSMPGRSRTR